MSTYFNLRSIAIAVAISVSLFAAVGCHRDSEGSAAAESVLTDTKLVDQNGNTVTLTSLKGKPLVVDFIYTSCPGPCLMETAKFANVALRLGPDLGSKVTLVSISVDLTPEVRGVLTVEGSVRARNARGGTAPEQVAAQLATVRETVTGLRQRLRR